MVVLSIIVVIVGLTVPRFSFVNRLRVMTELQKLSSFFTYLQHRAIASGQSEELRFDQKKRIYAHVRGVESLADGVEFGVISGALGPPSNPSHAITSAITFKDQKVVFLPDGTIESGTVYLTDREKKYMAALTTPIGDVSHLRLYSYQNGWKLLE